MTQTQAPIMIVGAGLAGSIAALLLARQGIPVTVIDPYDVYPPDFRCEKLTAPQLAQVHALGLERELLRTATRVDDVLVARGGRLIGRKHTHEACQRYDHMVNAVRTSWPAGVAFHKGRVESVAPAVSLTSGTSLEASLVILATGPGEKLRAGLGMRRRIIRENHSICIGFDLIAPHGGPLSPSAMTWYGEHTGDRIAFATLFPFAGVTRCNFFCYLDPKSPFIRTFRERPLQSLFEALPGLRRLIGDARVEGAVEIRITDLYEVDDPARDGVVLIGDAQHSSCPVTGTGVSRVLADTDRLCRTYIPQWLATPGMGAEKIARFYADDVKRSVDQMSAVKAERDRSMAVDTGWRTQTHRAAVFARSVAHRAVAGREQLAFRLPVSDAGRASPHAQRYFSTPR